ncbi:hypothetical protein CGZ93_06035 [Enemella dayhoffiae]|uniref:Uncharacterized protein n=1 Tax=Enemella dayhoffiae TaxID=2016507 RepID=A0A255H828_9ACTN|nr:hypothetical protein [Enemella dayhoffiae]OYO23496.1 hypothetical protein CGZ93_06035 [Enemella dayhoffiae]
MSACAHLTRLSVLACSATAVLVVGLGTAIAAPTPSPSAPGTPTPAVATTSATPTSAPSKGTPASASPTQRPTATSTTAGSTPSAGPAATRMGAVANPPTLAENQLVIGVSGAPIGESLDVWVVIGGDGSGASATADRRGNATLIVRPPNRRWPSGALATYEVNGLDSGQVVRGTVRFPNYGGANGGATSSPSATRFQVSLSAPQTSHADVPFKVTGLRPGDFIDVDGGIERAGVEAGYHYELRAGADGTVSGRIPAPTEGWLPGQAYSFTFSANGQVSSHRFVGPQQRRTESQSGGGAPGKTGGADHSGGLAKTGW